MLSLTESLNLKTIQWSIDTLDWKGITGGEMVNRVLNKVTTGDIILCHNNSDNILEGLELILNRLTVKGYKFVSVGDLIMKDNYYIDHLGIQRKK
jgi:peptidoglycan/xylan/chitin deacetylase (PgdA/CDA1 family)